MTTASLVTIAMRCAKRQVLIPSSRWSPRGDAVAIITVLQLPPSESFSIMVIVEFLYGMWLRPVPCAFSCSATTTCSSAWSERLMCFASISVWPSRPIL